MNNQASKLATAAKWTATQTFVASLATNLPLRDFQTAAEEQLHLDAVQKTEDVACAVENETFVCVAVESADFL